MGIQDILKVKYLRINDNQEYPYMPIITLFIAYMRLFNSSLIIYDFMFNYYL